MGFFDFLRGSGKQVELKPETLKAEISEIGYNANAYEVLVDEGNSDRPGYGRESGGAGEGDPGARQRRGRREGRGPDRHPSRRHPARTNPLQVESRFHTVQSGDTLSKIAREVYGDANAYMTIFTANNPMLKDPDKIYPGQVLRIPERGHRA